MRRKRTLNSFATYTQQDQTITLITIPITRSNLSPVKDDIENQQAMLLARQADLERMGIGLHPSIYSLDQSPTPALTRYPYKTRHADERCDAGTPQMEEGS